MTSFNIYDHATQQQIKNFKPTFLYIKRHSITGLLYFGKTVRTDIYTYNGSGKYWTKHIKKHGPEFIETVWFCLFTDIETLVDFSITFSRLNSVVESDKWANQIIENGLGGSLAGHGFYRNANNETLYLACSDERVISGTYVASQTGIKHSVERRLKNSSSHIGIRPKGVCKLRGIKHSAERKRRQSENQKGIRPKMLENYEELFPYVTCPHCDKKGRGGTMKRWHFENCKSIVK